MLKGIDISHYQNGLDLSKVKPDFVIIKATEGVSMVDKKCDGFYQKAKSLGILRGVYHFARPNKNKAVDEANFFVRNIKGYINDAILVLDFEKDTSNTDWAYDFLSTVYKLTGVKPIIYMSASVMKSNDWSKVANADYGLWVANYGTNNGTMQEKAFNKYPLKYWKFYCLWQYTSKGKVNGYNENLDLDVFYGDKNAWNKYGNISNINKVIPVTPSKKSNEEIAIEVINGKWGNGEVRKNNLNKAGYNYNEIQKLVNNKMNVKKTVIYNPVYYTVKRGDTLGKIAKKYNTTLNKLVNLNKIKNVNLIYVGQKIRIK